MINVKNFLASLPLERKPDQCPIGLQFLLEEASKLEPTTYLEIGCGQLAVVDLFSSLLPVTDGLAIGVDHRSYRSWTDWKNPNGVETKILIAPSLEPNSTVQVREALENRMVDVLFIDGNHYVPYVEWDWKEYSPFVRSGGLVIFHDYDPSPGAISLDRNQSDLEQQGPSIVCNRLSQEGYDIHIVPLSNVGTAYLYKK